MHTHEPQSSSSQSPTAAKAQGFAPRPFEVPFPGQERASSPSNPFPPRPHEVWMGEPAATANQGQESTEPAGLELEWNRISLYAEGQPPPEPPRWPGVQAKFAIGRPEDPYEQEADPVAGQTMPDPVLETQPTQVQAKQATPSPIPPGDWFSHAPQRRPVTNLFQAKLTIGQPNDVYEQEADQVAERVMGMAPPTTPNIQRQTEPEESEALQAKPLVETITPLVQRQELAEEAAKPIQAKCEACESEEQVQRSADGAAQAKPDLEQRLNASKGGGTPLSEEVRSFMEPRFGTDFSQVRVHTGSEAVQMNKEVGAQAFTHGRDVYFGAGKSPGINDLTAHELTHTIQQTGGIQARASRYRSQKSNKIQTKVESSAASSDPIVQLKQVPPGPDSAAPSPQAPSQSGPATTNAPGSGASPASNSPQGPAAINAPTSSSSGAASATNLPSATTGGTNAAAPSPSQGTGSPGTPQAGGGEAGKAMGGSPNKVAVGEGGKAPTDPQSDPAFQVVVSNSKAAASQEKQHEPAQAEAKEAQDAAPPPGNEVESKAQDKQVGAMSQQQPGTFNANAFKQALMEKIAAVIPNNEKDAQNFKDSNQIDSVRQDVSSQVAGEQKQAAQPIEEKAKAAPDTSGVEPKPVTPMQAPNPGTAPTDIGAKGAAPKPKTEAEVSDPLKASNQELDQQMAQANLTEDQLKKSNEPQFQEALTAKQEVQAHANTAPQAYRQNEQATLNQAQAEAQATSQTQLQGMHGQRGQLLAQVMGAQNQTKAQDTQKRAEIANQINGIYEATKGEIEATLSGLDTEVTRKFDAGAAVAKEKFETYVGQKMDAWKKQRYGEWYDVSGWDERVSDAWNGLPPEVNQFFVDGRQRYLTSMDATLTDIANFVAAKLNEAKQKINQGKQNIQKYVSSLPANLQQVGQEAAQNIQQKFDQLEESVNNKQNELIDSLAQKYSENLQQVDARIQEMKEANRGLKDKAKDAIGGVIKTILELKNMLMGVLAKAAGAIDKIIQDPIGFLGNLVAGIRRGFDRFVANIWTHLKKGLISWLVGTLASGGIQLPGSFDLKGIFTLVMQVLGLAYEAIRPKLVNLLGEKTVLFLEKSFDILRILVTEGIGGLWTFVQDKIGDLKTMVMDGIQNFVVESIVKAGVTWIVSLLNPASAFVKACKMIYDVIMFFIERGSQIAELVNAVTDSVAAIANGAVDGAAAMVENALAKSIPVVLGFMASLLGLGGISEKIQQLIKTVRGPIDKAIDWVIGKAVGFAKKVGSSKLGKGVKAGFAKAKNLKDRGVKKFHELKDKGKKKLQDWKEKAGKKLGFGKDKEELDDRTYAEKERDVHAAIEKTEQIANTSNHDRKLVEKQLPAIKREFKLKQISLLPDKNGKVNVKAEINPFLMKPLDITDEPELRTLLINTGYFGSSPTDIDKIINGVKSHGNGDAVFQFIRSGKFSAIPGYEKVLRQLKKPTMVHSVYMALDQASKIPTAFLERTKFEETPSGGGDVDLLVLSASGQWAVAYQFKGVQRLKNIKDGADKAAEQLINVPNGTKKIISIEVENGTYSDFLASANPSKGHLGFMGGINAFKAANPSVILKIRFSDGTLKNF